VIVEDNEFRRLVLFTVDEIEIHIPISRGPIPTITSAGIYTIVSSSDLNMVGGNPWDH
jgi:hypothetical protein